MNISAIIVAAGSGKRFGSKKQYEYLGKKKIFEITLSKFLSVPNINNIILVLPKNDIEIIQKKIKFNSCIKIIAGGKTRQHSVYNGLLSLAENTDIVKIERKGFILKTPERKNIFLAQTPQTFKYSVIMQAYKKAFKNNFFSTDDSALVEKLGKKVKVVLGDYKNIKITTRDDLSV